MLDRLSRLFPRLSAPYLPQRAIDFGHGHGHGYAAPGDRVLPSMSHQMAEIVAPSDAAVVTPADSVGGIAIPDLAQGLPVGGADDARSQVLISQSVTVGTTKSQLPTFKLGNEVDSIHD